MSDEPRHSRAATAIVWTAMIAAWLTTPAARAGPTAMSTLAESNGPASTSIIQTAPLLIDEVGRSRMAASPPALAMAPPAAGDDPAGPEIRAAPAGEVAAPADSIKALQALVIDVRGAAEWRPKEDEAWHPAKVNDLLDSGVQLRTGRKSSLALRVGKNATVLVESLTSIELPEMVQDGQMLRTRAALRRGRADFKVDEVGLANDFEVITPTAVTGVRGTGFGMTWGAFNGTVLSSLRGNLARAIEIRYFLTALRYYLDQRTKSAETTPDPAVAALFDTIGPPPMFGTLPSPQLLEQAAIAGFAPDQTAVAQLTLQQAPTPADFSTAFASPQEIEQFLAQQQPQEDMLLALIFCESVSSFFEQLEQALAKEFSGDIDLTGLQQLQDAMVAFCQGLEPSDSQPLQFILDQLANFCFGLDAGGTEADACLEIVQILLAGGEHGGGSPGGQ